MKLAGNCPYTSIPPERTLGDMIETMPCCRAHCLFRSLGDSEVPLCRSWGTEVYRFTWDSSFDGDAMLRIARLGDEIRLSRGYRPSQFARAERCEASLTPCDWARLQGALTAANFWALDPHAGTHGLDGACWTIEGRRKNIFRVIQHRSPGGELRDLGRLLFDLAGLNEVRITATLPLTAISGAAVRGEFGSGDTLGIPITLKSR